jgi:hypothetical protein
LIRSAQPRSFAVEYHHDPKGRFKFQQNTPDDVWIAAVAAQGWTIFSHDRKFHTIQSEISAIKQHSAGCFYLPGANDPLWDKVVYFMKACDGIIKRAGSTTQPFIFELASTGRFKAIKIP